MENKENYSNLQHKCANVCYEIPPCRPCWLFMLLLLQPVLPRADVQHQEQLLLLPSNMFCSRAVGGLGLAEHDQHRAKTGIYRG